MTHSNENSPPGTAIDLAKYPTPLHIYYRKRLVEDAAELESGLKSALSDVELCFSTKTNSLLVLLRELVSRNWSLEVVSASDLQSAIRTGIAPERVLLNGFAWTKDFLARALFDIGVRHLTIDSVAMAKLLRETLAMNPNPDKLRVAIRIHDGNSHFGVAANPEALKAVLKEIPAQHVDKYGLHFHRNPVCSPETAEEIAIDFHQRTLRLLEVEKMTTQEFSFFDLGGGMDTPWIYRPSPDALGDFHHPERGVAIRETNLQKRFSLRKVCEEVSLSVKKALSGSKGKKILFEPGRSVCCRAISTIIQVIAVKPGIYPEGDIVITDGNTAILGPVHRGVHPLTPHLNRTPGPLRNAFVYGNLPHSGDWLFQNIRLPQLFEGDRLVISHTGAYFFPLEANFGLPRPGVIDAETGHFVRTAEESGAPGIRDSDR